MAGLEPEAEAEAEMAPDMSGQESPISGTPPEEGPPPERGI